MMKKQKWKTAEQKRQHEQLQKEWESLLKKYPQKQIVNKSSRNTVGTRLSIPAGRNGTSHIPSISDSPGSIGAKKESVQYSGSAMRGISTLHKSNAVPIFSDDEAREHANMRR